MRFAPKKSPLLVFRRGFPIVYQVIRRADLTDSRNETLEQHKADNTILCDSLSSVKINCNTVRTLTIDGPSAKKSLQADDLWFGDSVFFLQSS